MEGGPRRWGAILRADHGLVLVLRQAEPLPAIPAWTASLPDGLRAVDDAASARWRVFGLDLTLPPHWRLEGAVHLVGLTRLAWMHHPRLDRAAVDQVLLVRRVAMASRMLGGKDPLTWLESQLGHGERLIERSELGGVYRAIIEGPGRTWWDRLRRRVRRDHFQLWTEAEMDRLLVQEWHGAGDPPPCLRTPGPPHDLPPPQGP
jgi:hypothetical protein